MVGISKRIYNKDIQCSTNGRKADKVNLASTYTQPYSSLTGLFWRGNVTHTQHQNAVTQHGSSYSPLRDVALNISKELYSCSSSDKTYLRNNLGHI
jgi:hypothetical protein